MANTYEDGGLRARAHHFGSPLRNFVQMLAFGAVVSYICYLAWPTLIEAFLANIYINSVIVGVLALGVVYTLVQVLDVWGAVGWVKRYQSTSRVTDGLVERAPYAVKPMAELLRDTPSERRLSSVSARAILDSVGSRLSEAGEITRYFRQLLIFLGLLGTFYGLATTIPGLVDTIRSLVPKEGETSLEVFKKLTSGLQSQLGGMGVAFASSLLGLAGSLVVGLLELFAGHGQNRFYRELEEWMSSITRVGFSSGDEGGAQDSGAMTAVLDHMAEQMQALQQIFVHSDQARSQVDQKLGALIDVIGEMNDRMDRSDNTTVALDRVAVGQETMIEVMRAQGSGGEGMDAESRMRLRSIDVQMLRILEEISAGRQESLAELRKDIDMLVKALARPRAAVQRSARDIYPTDPMPSGEEG